MKGGADLLRAKIKNCIFSLKKVAAPSESEHYHVIVVQSLYERSCSGTERVKSASGVIGA